MEYQNFAEKLIMEIERRMNRDGFMNGIKLEEWNCGSLTGIVLRRSEESMSPVLVLNNYYGKYQNGTPMESVIEEVIRQLKIHQAMDLPEAAQFYNFCEIKDRIIYQIIRVSGNEEILKEVPFVPFLDLAIVFYLEFSRDYEKRVTALIHKAHSQAWHVDEQVLYELAKKNTPHRFPEAVINLEHWLKNTMDISEPDKASMTMDENEGNAELPLYVLTNSTGAHRASCVLYDGVLKGLADRLSCDLYLLPSSIHEFLAIPYSPDVLPEELKEMVKNVNQTEVLAEEVLSDHVYLYTRSSDQISIAA